MTPHTPGPWIVDETPGRLVGSIVRAADTRRLVAEVRCAHRENGSKKTDAARLANARLIAAAPEMVALLRDLLPYVESCSDDEPAAKDAARIRALLARVR